MGKTSLGKRSDEINQIKIDNSGLLGVDSRGKNRKKRKTEFIKKTFEKMRQYLPELFYLENHQTVDADKFKRRWCVIDTYIKENAKNLREYRSIHNEICQLLEQDQRNGLWNLEIPNCFITLKQEFPTRSYQKHQLAIFCAKVYSQGLFDISPNQLSSSELFSAVLLSAIFHGGFNQPKRWVALGKCLKQTKPFEGTMDLLFLRLILEDAPEIATNTRYWDEEQQCLSAVTESVYLPDPITLGLINQLLRRKEQDWSPPTTVADCICLINETFNSDFTLNTLCSGGIAFAEQMTGISIPQVMIEIAKGNQATSSLPKIYWDRFFLPALNPTFDTTFQCFALSKFTDTQHSKKLDARIYPNNGRSYFYEDLVDIFRWKKNERKSSKELLITLDAIPKHDLSFAQSLLLDWFIHLLKDRKDKPSTLKQYFHDVAFTWLTSCENVDLSEMNSEDVFEFYQDILVNITKDGVRHKLAARLDDLHQLAVLTQGLSPLPESLSLGNKHQAHIAAGFVDEALFEKLLEQITRLSDLSSNDKSMFHIFLIFAYRLGLRPSEIVKLRMQDIERSNLAMLSIRSNKFGENKTSSAKRKIPSLALLTPSEKNLFKQYLHKRNLHNNESGSLLFSQPDTPFNPINLSAITRVTKQILTYLSGGNYYRFYHLRHSALSRLQLILHCKELDYPTEIDALIPYNNEQRKEILESICGKNRRRDRYHALASFAGHSDPSVTLSNYLHFSDLITGLILQNNSTHISDKQAQILFGLSPFQIRNYKKDHSEIMPKDVVKLIKRMLKAFTKQPEKHIKNKISWQKTRTKYDTSSKIADDYDVALMLLEKLQQGEDYTEFAQFYELSVIQISKWINAAYALKNIKTARNNSRLFPSTRKEQILPASLQDKKENDDIQLALKNYRLYCTSVNLAEIRWAVKYALTNCNSSRSGIYFDDADIYQKFMDIACLFFPSTRWRFHLKFFDKDVISLWQYKSTELLSYQKKQSGRFLSGAGWLELKYSKEEKRVTSTQTKYSSHSFRIFFHRLAIILFTADEIRKW